VGTDDGNLQVTQDGGKTWTNTVANIQGLPKNTWCYHIETSTIDKGTAYAVFDGHTANDKTPYAFKTTDFGKTWANIISDDVEGVVRNIQVDYESSDLLFLGTELGLYITLNGGEKWYKFTNNMPAVATHYITLQKETNDLVLGTHGRGIIIIDDISPLRELNEATQKKTLHFFESKPTVIKETQNFSGNFGNETQFVGANKSSQAQIKYHLKKRHTFGKMTMAIVNSEGDTLSELTPGKSKGINIVNWSFRKKQPKVAKGKTFSFGGFTTPVLPAGKYIAKIAKGKQTFEHPFELVYDAKSTVSSKDRVFKHKTVNEIYEMIETLAYKVYILDAYLDYATSSQKKKLIKKLNALKETMVITTGDNYVGAAEPQLREKMTTIFQRIEENYGAPTPDEIQNLAKIKNRFQSAVESLEKIIKKYKLKRMVPLKSLEEYLKS